MATTDEYTDAMAPRNAYPARIVSASHSGSCCVTHMEDVGPVTRSVRWARQYRRCWRSGFTLRGSLHHTPEAAWIEELHRRLETSFQRNVRDF